MSIRDLTSVASDESLATDICIIGSGPAGATIARELAGSRLRVLVLESGGLATQPALEALNAVENIGAPRTSNQSQVRTRALGGTSLLWSGRCASLTAADYQVRDWIPFSGWPIKDADISPYLERSRSHLGLGFGSGYSGRDFWSLSNRGAPPRHLNADLEDFFWQFSRTRNPVEPVRFGPSLLEASGGNIRVLTNATAVHITTDDAGAVRSVEVAAQDDRRRCIATRAVVLCAGAIENARLLLASNRQRHAGLGNQHDLVGRFLMDHLRGGVASFDPRAAAALEPLFGFHYVATPHGTHQFCQGLQLSPAAQQHEGLLSCAVWLSELVAPDDPWSAIKRLALRRPEWRRDLPALLGNPGWVARGLHRRLTTGAGMPRKLEALELQCIVEQCPDPNSRITLADQADRHGVPLSRVDWRIHELEHRTVRRTATLVANHVADLGLPAAKLMPWVSEAGPLPASFGDVAHHIGTTRMADDQRRGVVDRDCRVHGTRGLYVAGSSVFPTGGHVNPTQMIVALSIRLADTLKQNAARMAALETV